MGKTELCQCVKGEPPDISRSLERMGVPTMLVAESLASWQPGNSRPRLDAQNFVHGWPPAKPFFTLVGPPGRGKSHLAAAILRGVLDSHGIGGMFCEVPALLSRIRATFDEDTRTETAEAVIAYLVDVPILVLDDLGKERHTEWVAEQVFRLVDGRYGKQRPTVVTMNPEGLEKLEEAVVSRITGNRFATVHDLSKFPDRRYGVES